MLFIKFEANNYRTHFSILCPCHMERKRGRPAKPKIERQDFKVQKTEKQDSMLLPMEEK